MNIRISGIENTDTRPFAIEGFELEKSFLITSDRAGMALTHDLPDQDPENLAQVIYEDGLEWFGFLGDIHEVIPPHEDSSRSAAGGAELIIDATPLPSGQRGLAGKAIVRFFNIFTGKRDPAARLTEKLGEKIDGWIMPQPGMMMINEHFDHLPYDPAAIHADQKYLLLLHGTFSSTDGSFGDLATRGWDRIYGMYRQRVIACDHYTVSESPVENAIKILRQLPPRITLDLMSTSRGGLVADILARCDRRDEQVFNDEERDVLLRSGVPEAQLNELQSLARSRSIQINNQVRIACPAGGTRLLTERLDHFVNILLGALGLTVGGRANALYQVLRRCVMEIIANKTKVDTLPGLWAMAPGSGFQKANNLLSRSVYPTLCVIAGDAEAGGSLGNTLKVILTNLYFSTPNDFVVNTDSMHKGPGRISETRYYLSRSDSTNHFNYFKNQDSLDRIVSGLEYTPASLSGFETRAGSAGDRGISLKFGFGSWNKNNVSGTRPVMVILPGIMGSTLKTDEDIWIDFLQLASGKLVTHLAVDAGKQVSASGLVSRFYSKMGDSFINLYDLLTFPFDWRLSLSGAASNLKTTLESLLRLNQPVKIVAHSMGGLVVRQLMLDDKVFWDQFIARPGNQFVMLGTPWKGSHLIMEVLTGHSSRVKQLKNLDISHTQEDIMRVVSRFPGLYQLLPVNETGFETPGFWADIFQWVDSGQMVQPAEDILGAFATYKQSIQQGFSGYAFDKIYYIAGHADTVFSYEKKKSFFRGQYLRYLDTEAGDGSVTWKLGIPDELNRQNLYYCEVEHGELANDQGVFEALKDILRQGYTNKLSRDEPAVSGPRGLTTTQVSYRDTGDGLGQEEDILLNLFSDGRRQAAVAPPKPQAISVSVLNADLKYASYPVMVGHFRNDGIYSSEKALDTYLKFKLSARHKVGFYPEEIGVSQVIFHRKDQPKGALVLGLGAQGELTPYQLMLSVQSAILKYAFFFKDNYEDPEIKRNGRVISTVLIGSAFAGLTLNDSLRAIVRGVEKANEKIRILDYGLETIRAIEFIDYYEELAQQAYAILKRIETEVHNHNILVSEFRTGTGSRKKAHFNDVPRWWHTLTTEALPADPSASGGGQTPPGLSFTSASGIARVEKNEVRDVLGWAESFARDCSHLNQWDKELSKTLFELLIPNDFKDTIRNQNNILWKMDEYSAQFPWEMFNDSDFSGEPAFVNTGIVRQLITESYTPNPVMASAPVALVVGDPDYSGTPFPQLPGAGVEAGTVSEALKKRGFETTTLVRSGGGEIMKKLLVQNYKVLHFATHGVYEPGNVGLVLGKDRYLTPAIINQLPSVPELVFINCCYSGDTSGLEDRYYRERTRLAANIGPQLIRMGVKAAVVTGWAVNDAAAKEFANSLYELMLDGYEFGTATQMARRKCFDLYPYTNTWGAYQCYGDHYYKLVNRNPSAARPLDYVMESQVMVDLENFMSRIRGQKASIPDALAQLRDLRSRASAAGLESAQVLEMYAFIFAELGVYEEAIALFDSLRSQEKALFSVAALEQFCSLRGKLLVKCFRSSPDGELKAPLNQLFKDLKIIQLIGKTAERWALQGSTYKRAAIIEPAKRATHLDSMKKHFLEACRLLAGGPAENTVYPLSNYLLACNLHPEAINFETIARDLGLNKGTLPGAFLQELLKTLEENKVALRDYYSANAISKVHLCLFLFNGKPEEQLAALETSLFESIDRYANMKHILGEIEHYEFVIELLGDRETHRELLEKICEQLKARLRYGGSEG